MALLLALRHAQSVWNAEGRWQGWSDAPLSDAGEQQARHAGRALAAAGFAPALVACSDLARARRTAEVIGAELGFRGPIAVEPDLREQDLGEWNGLTSDQIEARWPAELAARREGRLGTVPGGETSTDFTRRCLGAVQRLAEASVAGGDALVVTHGGVLVALERYLGCGSPDGRHPNVSGWWLEVRSGAAGTELRPVAPAALSSPSGHPAPGASLAADRPGVREQGAPSRAGG